jgi:hypothetical protein
MYVLSTEGVVKQLLKQHPKLTIMYRLINCLVGNEHKFDPSGDTDLTSNKMDEAEHILPNLHLHALTRACPTRRPRAPWSP